METDATYRGTVYPWQCDHVGHMNIMWYVGKFDEANWNLFARLGLTPSYLRESGRGMAAVQQNIAYKRELLAGDIVEVRSRLAGNPRQVDPLPARDAQRRNRRDRRDLRIRRRAHGPAGAEVRRRSRPRSAARLKSISNRRWRERMSRFEPKNPDYRAIAIDTFEQQRAMKTLGISIARLEPGEVDLAMDYSADLTQQHGFIHAGIITAGLDNACGIAAFTLMPASTGILTVEFKTNLLAPARGERFAFRATVVKPGRTLTVCEARAYATHDGVETLIATMSGTLMALAARATAPEGPSRPGATA